MFDPVGEFGRKTSCQAKEQISIPIEKHEPKTVNVSKASGGSKFSRCVVRFGKAKSRQSYNF